MKPFFVQIRMSEKGWLKQAWKGQNLEKVCLNMLGGPKTSKGWLKHAKSVGAHLASKTRFCPGLRKPSQNGPKTTISSRETRFALHGHIPCPDSKSIHILGTRGGGLEQVGLNMQSRQSKALAKHRPSCQIRAAHS